MPLQFGCRFTEGMATPTAGASDINPVDPGADAAKDVVRDGSGHFGELFSAGNDAMRLLRKEFWESVSDRQP